MRILEGLYKKIKLSDKFLWLWTTITLLYGFLLIISASRNSIINFCRSQGIAILIGFSAMFIFQFINYKKIIEKWKFISILSILLMLYTLIFGINITGISGVNAKAWIQIPGGFSFQASELVKIGFILTLAKHLSYLKKKLLLNRPKELLLLVLHLLIPVVFVHLQGDDGAAIVFLCIFLFMTFMLGIKFRYFLLISAVFVCMLPIMWNYILAPYQKSRIINQFNPENDSLGMGYQQIQGKLSIGSGGFFGKGLFNGDRVNDGIVPIQESDFIFTVAGEELGFFGCFSIIMLIFTIIFRIIKIIKNCTDSAGIYVCFGLIGLIACQTILNLGMCLSLVPVIGVTLPFFSAGGSSLICLCIGIGILQNINIQQAYYENEFLI
ncbi:MAG: FtsW/RodA/SpoVE family cell cycle protein [Candidatus Improbicoccus devescovinae]|nr:MAG: FtsW/RodA/SpoVE family cell cycle protein [Candidatus Improbicoccus devescovinae]